MDDPRRTRITSARRPLLLALLFGFPALAGQICWTRVGSAVVGGTLAATALTLSGAMIGLSAGALLGSAAARRGRGRRALAAVIGASAAALALVPSLLPMLQPLEGFPVLRRILAALLLTLAHVPAGAGLPLLIALPGASGAGVYGFAALGSAAGALLGTCLLAPLMALDHLGVLLAAPLLPALFLIPKTVSALPAAGPDAGPGPADLGLAFLLGLLGLAVEFLWMRSLSFAWGSTVDAQAMVSAAFVGGLSLGAILASRRRGGGLEAPLAGSALALAATALLTPLALDAASFEARLLVALLLVGLPAAGFGAAFGRLLEAFPGPRPAGRLSAFNAAGSAAGPLLLWAAADLVPFPPRALALLACGYAALIALQPRGPLRAAALAGLLAAAGLGLAPSGPAIETYARSPSPQAPDLDATVLTQLRVSLGSTVAVTRSTRFGSQVLWIDRGFQGDDSPLGRFIPAALGRVPVELLGRPPARTLAVGLGTGLTLDALQRAGAREIDAVDLDAGILEAARGPLAELNGRVLDRDGVRRVHADGRAWLADTAQRYDLLVTDMIFPTLPGAGNLFSREYYRLARRRLTPDGLFVHWLPCFLLSPEDLSSAAAAFLEAFPDGSAFIGFAGPRRFILGLAGGRAPASRRLALGPEQLRSLAAGAAPLRDADPRLEQRSAGSGQKGAFGSENLRRVLDLGKNLLLPAWSGVAEGGFAERDAEEAPPGSPQRREARERAADRYREAARLSPGTTDAEFLLEALLHESRLEAASAAAQAGDFEGACRLLHAAAAPGLAGSHLLLADLLASRGDLKAAARELDAAAAKSPRSADIRVKQALLALNDGDAGRARTAFEAALRLRPDRPPLYHTLARQLGLPELVR